MLAYDYWSMQYSFFVAQTFFCEIIFNTIIFLAKRKCNLFFLCRMYPQFTFVRINLYFNQRLCGVFKHYNITLSVWF